MTQVSSIAGMQGPHFKGIALVADQVSVWTSEQSLMWLEQQRKVTRVAGYFFPQLQQTVYVLLVETPFTCDALRYVSGLTGPGTPFFQNQ